MTSKNLSHSKRRDGYSLIAKYSDPVATLRTLVRYKGLLSKVETIGKRMEKEAEADSTTWFQMGEEWGNMNKLCVLLRWDARDRKTVRGIPVYENALQALSKEYPHSIGYLNYWHNEMFRDVI